jgi:hypothetical protein
VALIGAAVLALGAGIAAYSNARASNEAELASSTHGARPPVHHPPPLAHAARYLAIVRPSNAARAELRAFVDAAPPLTPRTELDLHVAAYAAVARGADAGLGAARWPAAVMPAVQQLIAADRTLTADLQIGIAMLNQPGYGDKVAAAAAAVYDAANRVRTALGLPEAGQPTDPRFPPI